MLQQKHAEKSLTIYPIYPLAIFLWIRLEDVFETENTQLQDFEIKLITWVSLINNNSFANSFISKNYNSQIKGEDSKSSAVLLIAINALPFLLTL